MKYPTHCAWCAAKGKHTLVGYSEIGHSSGICPECSDELWQKAELKTDAEREARKQLERDEGRNRQHHKLSRESGYDIRGDGGNAP